MSLSRLNFTQINNIFLDEYMFKLSGEAIKVFLTICRKTIGWHKEIDRISNGQLLKITGIKNRHTLLRAIKQLIDQDLITVTRTGKGKNTETYYDIKFGDDENISNPVHKSVDKPVNKYVDNSIDQKIIGHKVPHKVNLMGPEMPPQKKEINKIYIKKDFINPKNEESKSEKEERRRHIHSKASELSKQLKLNKYLKRVSGQKLISHDKAWSKGNKKTSSKDYVHFNPSDYRFTK